MSAPFKESLFCQPDNLSCAETYLRKVWLASLPTPLCSAMYEKGAAPVCPVMLQACTLLVQSVWTDGSSILSVGLDQRLRTWKVRRRQEGTRDLDVGSAASASDGDFVVNEAESCAVQVLEPAALHAVQSSAEGHCKVPWVVGIVGRGTQVLRYT